MSSGPDTWVAVEPLDTVMVRDGRGADAGDISTSTTTIPLPSTVGGALGAALGGETEGHLWGPFVRDGDLLFPIPGDVVQDDYGDVRRLLPRPVTDGAATDLPEPLDHLLSGDGAAIDGLCTVEVLTAWLHADTDMEPGQLVDAEWWSLHRRESPWHRETRIGLTLRTEGVGAGSAEPGRLYNAVHLRPATGTELLIGCHTGGVADLAQQVVPFGGRGRSAAVSLVAAPELPRDPQSYPGGRVTVYLATPALLDSVLWQPDGARLCAIAVAGPQPVATASAGQDFWNSRRMAWAVPAGSVFYLDFGNPDTAAAWAQRYRGRLLPGQSPGLRLVDAGFGTFFTGRW